MNWGYFRWEESDCKVTKLLRMQTSRKKTSKLSKWVALCFSTRDSIHYVLSLKEPTTKLRNLSRTPQSLLSHFHGQSPHILCQSQAQICPTVLCQDYRAREEYNQTALFSMEINKGQPFSSQVKSLRDYSEYEWLDKCLRVSPERSTLCPVLLVAMKNVSQASLCPAF